MLGLFSLRLYVAALGILVLGGAFAAVASSPTGCAAYLRAMEEIDRHALRPSAGTPDHWSEFPDAFVSDRVANAIPGLSLALARSWLEAAGVPNPRNRNLAFAVHEIAVSLMFARFIRGSTDPALVAMAERYSTVLDGGSFSPAFLGHADRQTLFRALGRQIYETAEVARAHREYGAAFESARVEYLGALERAVGSGQNWDAYFVAPYNFGWLQPGGPAVGRLSHGLGWSELPAPVRARIEEMARAAAGE